MPSEARSTRTTDQRRAIERLLRESARPLTAHEAFLALRDSGSEVGLATVYRNLKRLAEEGVADKLAADSGEQAFLYCGAGHHHHLSCRVCGRVEEIRDCRALEAWTRRIAGAHRFTSVEHRAELVGICDSCAYNRPMGG